MRVFLAYIASLLVCIALASFVSYIAFFGFWFGARWFHSVPVARAMDAAGKLILLPARTIFYGFGGAVDQSMPISDPAMYSLTNGTFLGALLYAAMRRFIFRDSKDAGRKIEHSGQ